VRNTPAIAINSQDYWVKVVGMLQQNWALVSQTGENNWTIFFIMDGSGVFDQLSFKSLRDAQEALKTNGFSRFSNDEELQKFLAAPPPPFHEGSHPNGNIYSSGRFWKPTRSMMTRKRSRATVIVKADDGILLVVTRAGLVLLPGGGLSREELPIAGAARELHEETGMVATSLSFLFQHDSESNLHHVFLAEASGIPVADDDAVQLRYLTGSATESVLNLSPATRAILTKFQELEASAPKAT
jgi:ADP-ribose pyrophosphatase YjhB (NUDIX family)